MSKRQSLMPLALVSRAHPALRRPADPVTDIAEAERLARRMELTRRTRKGLAVAAPQVGRPLRLVVAAGVDDKPVVAINPTVIAVNRAKVPGREGCLSWPGRWFVVPRWEEVTVSAKNLNGLDFVLDVTDPLLARMWQHEIDHLDGKLIFGYPRAPDPLEQIGRR